MQSYQQTKRRKKRVLQAQVTKTVTVIRGKFGYGFTISGQNPCVLSCIVAGSPAQVAGLKAGDLLYVVNGQNVGRACHDDVVRMVGLSTGSLELQVAENYNSSDSSDEDYLPRTKSRYPNRVRTHQSRGGKNFKHERISTSSLAKQSCSKNLQQHHCGQEESDLSSSLTSQEDQAWAPLADNGKAMSEKKQDITDDSEKQKIKLAYSKFSSQPVMTAARKISSAVVKRVPPVKDYLQHNSPDSKQQNCSGAQANILQKSKVSESVVQGDHDENNKDILLSKSTENVTAIVGYIGSIETPSSHTRPHQRLQALRNAVKRLRLEKRVHTLVLMEVRPSGVLLTNAMGKQLALYPCDRIAYSGICPDDERFFGLVTLSAPDPDCSSHLAGGERLRTPNSSCHIFMIEPDICPHSVHVQPAPVCQAGGAANPQTGQCEQCPRSATSLILCIANLYRDKPSRRFDSDFVQSQAFADPTSQPEHRLSNTDICLGLRRDEESLEQNGQVCVVEMSNGRGELDASSLSVAGNIGLSPDTVDTAAERAPTSCLINSTNGLECWQQVSHAVSKLTPQAMPDPAYLLELGSPEMSLAVRSTESLKQNMQRYLEARQQLLEEQNCVLGSDGESYVGDHVLSLSVSEDGHAVLEAGSHGQWQAPEKAFVFAVPTKPPLTSLHHKTGRSAFHLLRSPSAPLGKHSKPVTVDLDTAGKLSPRAFPHSPPSSSVFFRSPSAPLFPHRDSDEDDEDCESEDDPYIRQILDQFNKDRRISINEDSRRFSEGFAVTKKCLDEPTGMLGVQKWTKTGSFRKPGTKVHKQCYSQSLESLKCRRQAVPDPDNNNLIVMTLINMAHQCTGSQVASQGQSPVRKVRDRHSGLKTVISRRPDQAHMSTLQRLSHSITKSFKNRHWASKSDLVQADMQCAEGRCCNDSKNSRSRLNSQTLESASSEISGKTPLGRLGYFCVTSESPRLNQTLGLPQSRHNLTLGSSQSIHNQTLGSSESRHNLTLGSSQSRHNLTLGSSQSRHNQTLGSSQSRHNLTLWSSLSRHRQTLVSSESKHNLTLGSSQSRHSQALGSSQSRHSQMFESSQSRHKQTLGSADPACTQHLPDHIKTPHADRHLLNATPCGLAQNSRPPAAGCGGTCLQDCGLYETSTAGWSLAVGETVANRLTTACSAHNIASNNHSVRVEAGRVATWAAHFDKLLQDQLGIDLFTKFLENEYSDENIRFWKVCEQFRDLTNDFQRKEQAKDIFARYLSTQASDPINVDNAARSYTEELLDKPSALMFDVAQQQIIQLMRLDSYPRFLKSEVYKNMLLKELEANTQAELEQVADSKRACKKITGKENGGKRRRSLLPWKHQKSVASDSEFKKLNKKGTNNQCTSNNQLNVNTPTYGTTATVITPSISSSVPSLRKTTGFGIDLSTMRREVFQQKEVVGNEDYQVKFCRIIMPDGSTTVVCAKPGQTCRSVLSKLCEKRAISIASVDVFLLGSDKPLDLSEDISTLGSKEIVIERRVLFRLDLANGKSVGAKAKPNRSIRNVLKPILEKYGYNLDNAGLKVTSCQEMIDLEMPVSMLDNQRAVIVTDTAGIQKQRKVPLFGLFRASEKRFTEHKRQHQWQGDFQSTKQC